MDKKEIFDAFHASGSAGIQFSAGMYKHEDVKQENFDGWDAAAWIMNLCGFFICIIIFFIHMASL